MFVCALEHQYDVCKKRNSDADLIHLICIKANANPVYHSSVLYYYQQVIVKSSELRPVLSKSVILADLYSSC